MYTTGLINRINTIFFSHGFYEQVAFALFSGIQTNICQPIPLGLKAVNINCVCVSFKDSLSSKFDEAK